MTSRPSITCERCGATSYNPNDVAEGYCGACHDWTGAVKALLPHNRLGVGLHWDRQGVEITFARWCHLYEYGQTGNRWEYASLAYDELTDKDGKTKIRVSTIWEGVALPLAVVLAHSVEFAPGPHGIFETMVFIDGEPTWRENYSIEAEARQQHATLVRSLRLVGAEFLEEMRHDN